MVGLTISLNLFAAAMYRATALASMSLKMVKNGQNAMMAAISGRLPRLLRCVTSGQLRCLHIPKLLLWPALLWIEPGRRCGAGPAQ